MRGHTPVLIAGGGPVGLALAAELGWRGIRCTLLEQGDGTIVSPKMNEVNTRTMEICRRWGIADWVMNCPFPGDFPLDAVFVTSLFGHELGRVERPARDHQVPEPASPYRLQACSQIWFDPMLLKFARSFPSVTIRHKHRLESFAHEPDGVTAEITDLASGERYTLNADYLVGCDGVASLVRRGLGIELTGKGTIGHPLNLFFRAPDLLQRSGQKPATFFIPIDAGGAWANLRIIDPVRGIWRLMIDHAGEDVTPDNADRQGYLRRALGRDIDVEWIDVTVWRRRSLVAERYGEGRVWLAGDAVHQLSPTGALGMNSGVGDAVDLGWKLAAAIEGWGGPHLVPSYDAERRPVGARNVRMATGFYQNNEAFSQWSPAVLDDTPEGERARIELGAALERGIGGEFRTLGLQIGYAYENSPICVTDGTPPLPDDPANYVPNARPGARAPHVWLREGHSTLDLFGRGFVLMRFDGGAPIEPIVQAAAARRVPLTVHTIASRDAAALYARKLALVRPDGHMAWRGDEPPSDPGHLLDTVRGAR
ncbi:MAG TPA: FAD-dependent monooxygenase [Pseudolabrys sp.]|jgi:2-polyprenyl-6-methoxyphenol hydroxylase-like FAD-dependent oxidoreductase|nr:FAD-dependent monooxygenase [Pseudolabrys sp.]